MNPEPLAPFVDLFIIGEAEPLLPPVMEQLMEGIGVWDALAPDAGAHPGQLPREEEAQHEVAEGLLLGQGLHHAY